MRQPLVAVQTKPMGSGLAGRTGTLSSISNGSSNILAPSLKKTVGRPLTSSTTFVISFFFFLFSWSIFYNKKEKKRPFCISLSPGDKKRWTQLETIKGARASILWAFKGCDERVAYYDSDRLMRRCVCPVTFTGPSTNFDQLLVSASAAEPIELPRGQFHRGGSEGTRWITFCGRRRRISTGFL